LLKAAEEAAGPERVVVEPAGPEQADQRKPLELVAVPERARVRQVQVSRIQHLDQA